MLFAAKRCKSAIGKVIVKGKPRGRQLQVRAGTRRVGIDLSTALFLFFFFFFFLFAIYRALQLVPAFSIHRSKAAGKTVLIVRRAYAPTRSIGARWLAGFRFSRGDALYRID